MNNKQTGKLGEDMACDYLTQLGYDVIERNFQKRSGEIDIIAWDNKEEEFVFVEVKHRKTDIVGRPEEAVTSGKIKKIISTAYQWLEERDIDDPWRIDIISITNNDIKHFTNISQEMDDILS